MRGVTYILLAELCFALSSVFAKLVLEGTELSGLQITFFRFLMGAFVAFIAIKRSGESFIPQNIKWISWRALFNTASAMCFFYSLKYTTITNANMLGMTYPLWVVLVAPLIIGEIFRIRNLMYVGIALVGIYLIVLPDFNSVNRGDLMAFIAGITASVAVIALRQARKHDSTNLIIFYLMATGLVINTAFIFNAWTNPTLVQWAYILISALLGLIAQIFVTKGYKYIEASRGSIVSSSRILMAALLGVFIFSDNITIQLFIGGALILSSQIALLFDKIKFAKSLPERKN